MVKKGSSRFLPSQKHVEDKASFVRNYLDVVCEMANGIDDEDVERASAIITETIKNNNFIFTCGNGGSMVMADHLVCDLLKGIGIELNISVKVLSLNNSMALTSAISNDIGYEYLFDSQLDNLGSNGDICVLISSSGNSKNIINALHACKKRSIKSILLCGFDGGMGRELADIFVHIPSDNYGIVEDLHHVLMHVIYQRVKLNFLNKSTIDETTF